MDIPGRKQNNHHQHHGHNDHHENDIDIDEFRDLLESKSDNFLRVVFSELQQETKEKFIKLLQLPSETTVDFAVSPSTWDCPIYKHKSVFKKPSSPSLFKKSVRPHNTIHVVIPSLSVDAGELQKIEGSVFYEERQLFNILALIDPNVYVIYVTALPLHPSIVNYYLSFLPEGAEKRLTLFSTFDGTNMALTEKIISRPRLQAKIRRIIEKIVHDEAIMICFIPTANEHKLASSLGVLLEASPEDVQFWGSKTGSRQIFKECDIPLPQGVYESLWDADSLSAAVVELWDSLPNISRVIVKLNEGFSGEGNALFELSNVISSLYENFNSEKTTILNDTTKQQRIEAVRKNLSNLRFQSPAENWDLFSSKIKILGCIVEQFIEGDNKQSPSLQGLINSDGSVQIVSTHEQILGGKDDQVYLGCKFPCDPSYRVVLHEYGLRVAKSLAKKGAKGRFGVDFIAVPGAKWEIYALEINLRQGGTTHPYETLHYLTTGTYSSHDGIYTSSRGEEKYYIASDNICKPAYKGLLPSDLMTIIGNHSLLFEEDTHTGVVFHLMGALSQYGKVGATCIGNSYEEAQELYDNVISVLDQETGSA